MTIQRARLGKLLAALLMLLVCLARAQAQDSAGSTVVDKVQAFREGDIFSTQLETTDGWKGGDVQATFAKSFIQIDLPSATLSKGKQIQKIDDRIFRSIYVAQPDQSSVRVRLNLKNGISGEDYEKATKIRKSGNLVVIDVRGEPVASVANIKINNNNLSKKSRPMAVAEPDEAVSPIAVRLVAGSSEDVTVEKYRDSNATNAQISAEDERRIIAGEPEPPAQPQTQAKEVAIAPLVAQSANIKTEPASASETAKLAEDQIPVLVNAKEEKKSAGGAFQRIMITLAVLTVILGGAVFGLKRWGKRNSALTAGTRIKVLTQHHLGPKKSLAIIQVAGETLLVGITDHNISHLKTLALLDEEIPEETPRHFGNTLADFADEAMEVPARNVRPELTGRKQAKEKTRRREQEDHEDDFALRGLADIRDIVSDRLKNMRNL